MYLIIVLHQEIFIKKINLKQFIIYNNSKLYFINSIILYYISAFINSSKSTIDIMILQSSLTRISKKLIVKINSTYVFLVTD